MYLDVYINKPMFILEEAKIINSSLQLKIKIAQVDEQPVSNTIFTLTIKNILN